MESQLDAISFGSLVPHPPIYTPEALAVTTLPIYPGLGQAQNMLACIPHGLVHISCFGFIKFLFVVKATTLKQQISKFYLQIQRTEAGYHSQQPVRERMREFNWLTMCDLIDIRKRKFLANYILSENILCQVVANVCIVR